MQSLRFLFLLTIAALLCAGAATAQIDSVGGPYTVDTNTVMLLHFDGNLNNAAAAVGKTATAAVQHTTIANGITFVPNAGVTGLGQCVRINNGAITDSSFLTLADTPAVDLTGDWTIEAWAQILTFGDVPGNYKWVPRVVMKPGLDEFWHPNYWMEMWGDSRTFQTGFYTPDDQFISGTSPINMFVPGEWVHLTFIRDTKRGIIVQMVHDANRKLKSFTSTGFDPATQIPRPNINPVHMGWAGGILNTVDKQSVDSWLDGYLDEIRISKVVRNFPGPPLVTNTTVLPNQPSGVASYTIHSKIQPFTNGATIDKAWLHYYVTKWDSVQMTAGVGSDYSGNLPGQAFGTTVKYYTSATDNQGLRSTEPQAAEYATPTVFSFLIFQPNVQLVYLTFDEGTGHAPLDHSPNPKTVIVPGRLPDYSTDAKQGTYSLKLTGNPNLPDSGARYDTNWVEVVSDFWGAPEFSLDLWLKPDTAVHACRIINAPTDSIDYFTNNYELEFRNNAKNLVSYVGRYSDVSGNIVSLQDTNAVRLKKWSHITWERKTTDPSTGSGIVAFRVGDENDNTIYFATKTGVATPQMAGSKTPTHLRVGRAQTNNNPWTFIYPYWGLMDAVKLYNYPASGLTDVKEAFAATVPGRFELSQNFPNPFNPSTEIHFLIPKAQNTTLVVYDLLGRKVRTLVNEELHAGEHLVTWNGLNDRGHSVASGVYFYTLTSGSRVKTLKMMMLK